MKLLPPTLALLLLSACASAPETTPVAGLPTPEDWSEATPADGPIREHWWTSFGSTGMVSVVNEALMQNLDLRQALARLEAAMAQARVVGAEAYPSVNFTGDAARRQQVFVGLPIPGGGGEPLKSLSTTYGAAFNLSWELDVWGRIRAGTRAAVAEVQASEADFHAAQLSVAAQTSKAWLAVAESHRQLELAYATEATFTNTAWQVRRRYEQGLRSALDLRLALNNASVAKALVPQRERLLQTSVRQLELILGRYPAAHFESARTLPPVPGPIPAGLPSELLERRPDLIAAERRLAATLQRVKEAKTALLPRISLTASGGRSSADLEDLVDSKVNMWSLAANLAQPIFQGGRLLANIDLAQARARGAVEQYRAVVLRAFAEVEEALGAEELLHRQEVELTEAARQSAEALRLAEERYALGLIDFVTLVESQRSAYNSESASIEVRRQRLDNRVNLHLALGGGFGYTSGPALAQNALPQL